MLGFPILYFRGMRLMMFPLSGFYCKKFLKKLLKWIYKGCVRELRNIP